MKSESTKQIWENISRKTCGVTDRHATTVLVLFRKKKKLLYFSLKNKRISKTLKYLMPQIYYPRNPVIFRRSGITVENTAIEKVNIQKQAFSSHELVGK